MNAFRILAFLAIAGLAFSAAAQTSGTPRIDQRQNKAAADGKVTAKERARVEKAQDRESRKIHRQKHDKQTAK